MVIYELLDYGDGLLVFNVNTLNKLKAIACQPVPTKSNIQKIHSIIQNVIAWNRGHNDIIRIPLNVTMADTTAFILKHFLIKERHSLAHNRQIQNHVPSIALFPPNCC